MEIYFIDFVTLQNISTKVFLKQKIFLEKHFEGKIQFCFLQKLSRKNCTFIFLREYH